jgi:hypothetical protein
MVPFQLNTAQRRYCRDIAGAGVARDIVAKARKWGFSTLRLGLQLHGVLYRPGRIARTYVHREKTAYDLADIIHTLFDTAQATLDEYNIDPRKIIPKNHSNGRLSFDFAGIKSQLIIETAGGKGVGQAGRTNDAYLTEYADWERPKQAWDGIVGSIPLGAQSGNRVTVDFNANELWMSGDAYIVFTEAQQGINGFTPFFAGVLDVPEVYTPEALAEKRQAMRDRYPLSYPETAEDLFKQRDRCVYDLDDIKACTYSDYATGCEGYLHGVDTSPGNTDGDYQACTSWGWVPSEGRWQECAPAIRTRIPEDMFADLVDARVRQFPGVCVVERNVGSAVLVRLRDLSTPGLYKHKHRDKDGRQVRRLGFLTTGASKRITISELQRALRERTIGLVTPMLIDEMRDFEWKDDTHLAGAPDREKAHDDLETTARLALAGQHYSYHGTTPAVQYR